MAGRNTGKIYRLIKPTHSLLFFVILRCSYLQIHSLSVIASICGSDERRLYRGLFFVDLLYINFLSPSGPLFRNHDLEGGGASFQKGTSFLIQEIFLFMNSLGKPVFPTWHKWCSKVYRYYYAAHLCDQDSERIYGWSRVRKNMGLLQGEF